MAEKEVRLIDADALLTEFLRRYTKHQTNKKFVFTACEIKQDFADMMCEFPTIDPESLRPHGKWIPYYEEVEIYNTGGFTERKQTGWICGRCKSKKSFTSYYKTNYCPNCGAKMEG